MKAPTRRLFVLVLAASLAACQSTRAPVLDPQQYAFEVQVHADPEVPELFEPDVVRGKRSGAASGAGRGMSGCIRHGADHSDGGAVLMALLSPICAVVGGVVGAGRAESASDIDARLIKVEELMRAHASREALAGMLARGLGAIAVYDGKKQRLRPDPQAYDGEYRRTRLMLTVGDIGLTGEGIDPPLNLAMLMHVCVRDAGSDEMMLSQTLQVLGPARKLEKWAKQGEAAWHRDAGALAESALADIGKFLRRATSGDAVRPCPEAARPGAAQEE